MNTNFLKFSGVLISFRVKVEKLLLMKFNKLFPGLLSIYWYPLIFIFFALFEVYFCKFTLSNSAISSFNHFDILYQF